MSVGVPRELLEGFEGRELFAARTSRDGVNPTMIRHWCLALGDDDLRYAPGPDQVAPPAMLQAWCIRELDRDQGQGVEPELDRLFAEHGFDAVVATECRQSYERDLRPGDVPVERRVIESISPLKRTALGEGHFVTTVSVYEAHGEVVGTMRFTTLRYTPAETGPVPSRRPLPSVTEDNRYFFDGAAADRLLVRRCGRCGRLQHPPTPMCPTCGGSGWVTEEMAGTGRVHTFTVTHHPPLEGFEMPFVPVVVELDEGPRIVSDLVDVEPSEVHVGMEVEVTFRSSHGQPTLPFFRPAGVEG